MSLWTEKYRPTVVRDAVLPKSLKTAFQSIVDSGDIPNMLLSGSQGTGKTTIARALCNELGADYIFINGSDERNIETLRNKIRQFASTVSLQGGIKVVIIDEADYLNAQSTQPAMRAFIEEFHNNCRFILTCNNKGRIIDPLRSRLVTYDFVIAKSELPALAASLFKRAQYILDQEGIPYNKDAVAALVSKTAPDWRQCLNILQSYSRTGEIDAGVLTVTHDAEFKELIKALKERNFKNMRKWIGTHSDIEPVVLFRKLYDISAQELEPSSIPNLVLILAEYQDKATRVMDQEINAVACMTEIMSGVEWKA
jgi:DNA polymerase III delta prime subunit